MRSNRRERRGENKRESGEGGEGEKERGAGGKEGENRQQGFGTPARWHPGAGPGAGLRGQQVSND